MKTILGKALLLSSLALTLQAAESPKPEVTMYGSIRVDGIYNTAGFNSAQSPILVIKQPAGRTPGPEVDIHPRLTRIGTNLAKHYETFGGLDVKGKIEVDFQNGGSESRELLRLRHAYVDVQKGYFSLLFGQTWQVISRLIPMANGDTLMWGAGNTGDRSPQARATFTLPLSEHGKLTVEGALQQIGTIDNKGQVTTNFGPRPAYQGRVAIDLPVWTKKPIHLAAAVHKATEVLAEKSFGEDTFNQFGIFTEFGIPLLDNFCVRGEFYNGENITDLRGGLVFGINPITDEEVPTQGFWGEARLKLFDVVTLGYGYGQDNPDDDYIAVGAPAYNEALWAVAHYQMTPDLRLGVEYIQWGTEYKGEQRLKSDRFNANILWLF